MLWREYDKVHQNLVQIVEEEKLDLLKQQFFQPYQLTTSFFVLHLHFLTILKRFRLLQADLVIRGLFIREFAYSHM